jgi:choline dehydrogenase-like flavoprotein
VHFLHRSVQDLYFIPERAGSYDKGGTLNFLLPPRPLIYTAEKLAHRSDPPLWGEALKRAIYRHHHELREIEFEVFSEFLANPGTYVTLSDDVRDKWGQPAAVIHLENHPEDVRNNGIVARKGLEILRAAGAVEAHIEDDRTGNTTFILQHGTCRFGTDARESVLDMNCRAHSVDNLYVVDGSFMPSAGGVATTQTIYANAFRVGDHLVSRFSRGEVPAR